MSETLVKICGLTTPDALDAAIAAGASHVGLVHYPPSPRHVDLEQAAVLRRRVPESVKVVLVTVNMPPLEAAVALETVRPDVLQLHGGESAEWARGLKNSTPLEIWKAWGLKTADSITRAGPYADAAHRVLFDAPARALPGGNGVAVDWHLLAENPPPMTWGLAGGLTPDNVAEAIRITGAPLVDASSGVESAPGVKDLGKIRAFIEAVRAA